MPAHSDARDIPDLRQVTAPDGTRRLELSGPWNLRALQKRLADLMPQLAAFAAEGGWQWDMREVSALDHAGALVLWRAWGGRRIASLALRPEHETLFGKLALPPEPRAAARRLDWAAPIAWLGQKTLSFAEHLLGLVTMIGNVVLDLGYVLREPARMPWREISAHIYRTGAQALGITALVGFLIGVVLSYLSSHQLKLFGADVYIVNIVGVSVVRELGPMLAAILVAGRSGSAMTAQLGVMRVTEELDAMSVMGIPHALKLILPKIIALAVSLPLIVLWTDAVAIAGGMVAAQVELGLSPRYFIDRLPEAVPIANFWLGIGKGAVFGMLIALIACHFGLRIRPNTESLGAGTTDSVVTAVTVVILADAVFAIIFKDMGVV
ncbi:MAG: ABC transporter permease [Betaproteobacteria bacterium]|nr:ABC transporter permease [Betaproteobacteria bacterium]